MKTCSRCKGTHPFDAFDRQDNGSLRPYCKTCKRLDAAPLQEWIRRKTMVYGSTQALADVCKVDEKVLRRVMEQQRVTLRLADELLVEEGSTMLWELWID